MNFLPSYQECIDFCNYTNSPFYESKIVIDGFPVSIFNYRLSTQSDFLNPKAKELRGLTFVFNKDGSLFKRYILLEKFFNLNQAPESMYSVVKNYKIKWINNKEDGSLATFIKLPNGKVIAKTKMGFDNEQAVAISRLYKNRDEINFFVNRCLDNDIVPIFEYVSPSNRIVLRYNTEDLILLRLRNNSTGEHLDLVDYLPEIGTIKIAPFEDEVDLDLLIEVIAKTEDREGVVVQAKDDSGRDFFFKIKTPWYLDLHGLLTNDIYKENILCKLIIQEGIDDVISQIPKDCTEDLIKINKVVSIIKGAINQKVSEIENLYVKFKDLEFDKKTFAINYLKDPNFSFAIEMNKGKNSFDLAKDWILNSTRKLKMARAFLKERDSSLVFNDIDLIEE